MLHPAATCILAFYMLFFTLGGTVQAQPHAMVSGHAPAWMQGLSAEQQQSVAQIMQVHRPKLDALAQALRTKMKELQAIAYDSTTDPDILSRLGQELQILRDAMRQEVILLDQKLQTATGITAPLRGRGCGNYMHP